MTISSRSIKESKASVTTGSNCDPLPFAISSKTLSLGKCCFNRASVSEGFPLEGKLSAQQTDEVSSVSNLQFFCQKIYISVSIRQISDRNGATSSGPHGPPCPGRCRSPLWLKICHWHIFFTRRALKGKARSLVPILKFPPMGSGPIGGNCPFRIPSSLTRGYVCADRKAPRSSHIGVNAARPLIQLQAYLNGVVVLLLALDGVLHLLVPVEMAVFLRAGSVLNQLTKSSHIATDHAPSICAVV